MFTVALKTVAADGFTSPVTLPGVDRVAQRQETTRDRLLQAAQACYLERGHTQATTRNIAEPCWAACGPMCRGGVRYWR